MQIKYLTENDVKSETFEEMSISNRFARISYGPDLKQNILEEYFEGHNILFLDLIKEPRNIDEFKQEINSPEFLELSNDITLLVLVEDDASSSSLKRTERDTLSWVSLTPTIPYPNIDLMKIVDALGIPWQAIYNEYFWSAISQGGRIILFDNKTFKLTEEDVVLFLLGSRYLSKIRFVFKFSDVESKRFSNTFKTLTFLLHGLDSPNRLPISSAKDFVSNYNIAPCYNIDKIVSYISDENGNLKLLPEKMALLAQNISEPLKRLNFDYWLKAIVGRFLIERNKKSYISKYSSEDYANAYHEFSGLEHSTDFVFVSLFEFADHERFDQYFAKAIQFV